MTALRRPTLRRGLTAVMVLSLLAVPGVYMLTQKRESAERRAAEELPLALHGLERAIGYAGFIHSFKNAILRPDEPIYYDLAEEEYLAAIDILRDIHELGMTIGSDLRLSGLHATLAAYRAKLDLARAAAARGLSISEVDELVRQSDSAATLDLLALQDEITQAIASWQAQDRTTARIQSTLLSALLLLLALSTGAMILTGSAAQRDRERRAAELHDRLASLGQVTSGLAHDVNNLLATIYYALELARNEDLPPAAVRYLQSANRAVARGKELTGRLLSISRPNKGAPETRAVAGLFMATEELTLPQLEGTGIELSLDAAEPGLMVHCDPGLLQDALLNLVLNARDAITRSGEGGHIHIRARSLDPATLRQEDAGAQGRTRAAKTGHVPLDPARRYVELTVSDDGPGMSKDVRNHALDPFFTTSRDGTGVGLGLSMAFSFARGAGGDLRLDSARGAGTVIQLILPRDPLPEEAEGEAAEPKVRKDRSRRSDAPLDQPTATRTDPLPRGEASSLHLSGMDAPARLASTPSSLLQPVERPIRLSGAAETTAQPFAAQPAAPARPADPVKPVETPPPAARPVPSTPTVLVAEDEAALRLLLVETLRSAGFEVLAAENGAVALSLLQERGAQSVDLLLTDVMMPELDGFGLAKQARDLRADLPVVYLTGFVGTGPENSPRPLVNGPVLRKPCPPDRLISTLNRTMSGSLTQH